MQDLTRVSLRRSYQHKRTKRNALFGQILGGKAKLDLKVALNSTPNIPVAQTHTHIQAFAFPLLTGAHTTAATVAG
ncbi:hypothetical protein L2E82_51413 [Cichorium intybus]|nr:hypothetical protein L2E82_51413 [Cichorium intybus]